MTISDSDDESELQVMNTSSTKLRVWLCCLILVIVISPIVSIFMGLHLHVTEFKDKGEIERQPFNGRTIVFEVVLISADPVLGTMTFDWNIIGETLSPCSKVNVTGCSPVNIYFDDNLIRTTSDSSSVGTPSNDRPVSPIFRLNATALAVKDIMNNSPTFRANFALFARDSPTSSLLYYPFDRYFAEVSLFAQDAITNETVGVIFGKTRGIALGFQTTFAPRTDSYIPPGTIDFYIILSRGRFIKMYAIFTVISIWLITLILLLVMITSVFFGFRQKSEILVVPVATVFAFTQLRASMPGAPPGLGDLLGAFRRLPFQSRNTAKIHQVLMRLRTDFVGILPCLIILSTSAALILGAFLFTDPTSMQERPSWRKIGIILFKGRGHNRKKNSSV